jgi:hypothetical protein
MAPWWRIKKRESPSDGGPSLRSSRTLECQLAAHDDCGHALGFIGAAEGEITLCSCACHEPCPFGRQGSANLLEFLRTCTCPATMRMRPIQEQAGIDLAQVAQLMEARRHMTEQDKNRELVRVYETAAALAAGQPPPHPISFDGPPEEMTATMVYILARRYSEAEAARLLGLSVAQVTAAVKARGTW